MVNLYRRVLTVNIIIMKKNIAVDTAEVTRKTAAVEVVVMMKDRAVEDAQVVVEVIRHLLKVIMLVRHAGFIIREHLMMEHSLIHHMTEESLLSSYVVPV